MEKNFSELSKLLLEKFVTNAQLLKGARLTPPSQSEIESATEFLKSISIEKCASLSGDRRIAQYNIHSGGKLFALNWEIDTDTARDIASATGSPVEILDSKDYHFLIFHKPLQLNPSKALDERTREDLIHGPLKQNQTLALSTLQEYSTPFVVIQVDASSKLDIDDPIRAGYFLRTFDTEYRNKIINKKGMDSVRELLLIDHEVFPIENIPIALSIDEPKYVFLELYRCLELAYSWPRVQDLLNRLNPYLDSSIKKTFTLHNLAKWCNDDLGWRRIERDSVRKIFLLIAKNNPRPMIWLCQQVRAFNQWEIASAEGEILESQVHDFSDLIYDIRNQVAHQFWPEMEKDVTRQEYEALIEFVIESLVRLYSIFPSPSPP